VVRIMILVRMHVQDVIPALIVSLHPIRHVMTEDGRNAAKMRPKAVPMKDHLATVAKHRRIVSGHLTLIATRVVGPLVVWRITPVVRVINRPVKRLRHRSWVPVIVPMHPMPDVTQMDGPSVA